MERLSRDRRLSVDEVDFFVRLKEDRRLLFESHRREVMLSVRHWERYQMRDLAKNRASRLARFLADNEQRIQELGQGVKTYNFKSIRDAAVQGDVVRLTELLKQGFSPDAPSAMGLTPLMGACQSGALGAVRVVLQSGADVNHQHIKTKRTALMEACARGYPDIVRELLRYGARINLCDAHGETALDCAINSHVRDLLELANSTWSIHSAGVFPVSFREVTKALLLVQKRQHALHRDTLLAARRELSLLRQVFVRSAAEAKVEYDRQVRASREQITLLRMVESLVRAETQFEQSRIELYKSIEQALLSIASLGLQRVLPSSAISTILARHEYIVTPTAKARRLHKIPQSLQAEWENVEKALQEACDQLRQAQEVERPDVKNGVTRNSRGDSLSRLQIKVLEAQNLPYRDPRVLVPIDPLVRIKLQNQVTSARWETETRVGERHPVWEAEFELNVESSKYDLVVEVVDATQEQLSGEVKVPLRSLLDQKVRDEWFVLAPTLRQQVLEKHPREQAARIHLTLRLVHTPTIVLARDIHLLLLKRDDVLGRKRDQNQRVFEDCIQKLAKFQL